MRWRPDVCTCIIDFNGDWQNPVVDAAKSKRCPAHAAVSNLHATVWNECKRKEGVRAAAKAAAFANLVLDSAGDFSVPWSFTGTGENRTFVLDAKTLSAAQKAALQAAVPAGASIQ